MSEIRRPHNGRFPIADLLKHRESLIGRTLIARTYANFDGVVKGPISDVQVYPLDPASVIITISWSRKQIVSTTGDLPKGDSNWSKKSKEPRSFVLKGSDDTTIAGVAADLFSFDERLAIPTGDGGMFGITRKK